MKLNSKMLHDYKFESMGFKVGDSVIFQRYCPKVNVTERKCPLKLGEKYIISNIFEQDLNEMISETELDMQSCINIENFPGWYFPLSCFTTPLTLENAMELINKKVSDISKE